MHLLVIYVPWIGSLLAEFFLLNTMLRHRFFRRFPWFFASIGYDITRQVLLLILVWGHFPGRIHFYSYWVSILPEYMIALAVIYEIFRSALKAETRFSPAPIGPL